MKLRSAPSCALVAGAIMVLVPGAAGAQTPAGGTPSPWTVRLQVGGGTTIHGFRGAAVDTSTVAVQGTARLRHRIVGPLGVQAAFTFGRFFPNVGDHLGLIGLTAGLSADFALGRRVDLVLDANGGFYAPGVLDRGGVDGGLAIEFRLSESIGLGPFGRYTRIFEGAYVPPVLNTQGMIVGGESSHDVDYWVAGISLAYHPAGTPPPAPPPPPPPADEDHDGVNDDEDRCDSVPAGDHPDPERPGCPLRDEDGDGVFDRDDQCPTEAAGDHADPQRAGCPQTDEDRDGVYLRDDQCPTDPAGEHPDPSRAGCPDADDDHDNVYNHDDQCPAEAAGVHPDPARRGCPQPDRDHDNVPDAVDRCPDRPGAPSPNPARNGCPGLVSLEAGQIRINRPVFFGNNSDVVLPTSFPVLQAVADALRATPEVRRVSVEGHTDDVGPDERNLDLSRRRAASVVRWLTAHNIEASRLASEGFGETRPVRPTEGVPPAQLAAVRAANRRVEFRILEIGDPPASTATTTSTTTTTTGATTPATTGAATTTTTTMTSPSTPATPQTPPSGTTGATTPR